MAENSRATVITQALKPWEYIVFAIVIIILCGFILSFNDYSELIGWISALLMGIPILSAVGICLRRGLTKVTVDPKGVASTHRQIAAEDVRTIVYICIRCSRVPLTQLVISSQAAKDMEAAGERKLRKRPLIRSELKFREGRSDWGDVCLRAGFDRKGTIWIEYSPEREKLLRELYPHAEYREAKYYRDPPSRV